MIDLRKFDLASNTILSQFPIPVMYSEILNLYGNLEEGSVCCPFHGENTPSFSYAPNVGNGIWKCFGACNKGGDTIELYRFYVEKKQGRKISRVMAVEQLIKIPRIKTVVGFDTLQVSKREAESMDEFLHYEYSLSNKKMSESQKRVNSILQSINRERDKEKFIQKYDELLKLNWEKEGE